jgi:hypothetical protein
MIKLVDLLRESQVELIQSKNKLIQAVLEELTPLIESTVEKTEKHYLDKGERFSDYDRKMTQLQLQFDLVKSLEKYTKPDDRVLKMDARPSRGAIEVFATVERDGQSYVFSTQVIYAGGYNIQKLHFRYLTDTNLPQTGQDTETKRIKQEIAKLTKTEKIYAEIERYEERIRNAEARINASSGKSDQEILDIISDPLYGNTPETRGGHQFRRREWEELDSTARNNFNNDEKTYTVWQDEQEQYWINAWKSRNIKSPTQEIANLQSTIKKLRAKLNLLN